MSNNKDKRWSNSDIEILRTHYNYIPGKELAQILGRTLRAVYKKAYALGLTFEKPFNISKDGLEEMYLKQRMSIRAIAKRYNCSRQTVLEKLQKYKIDINSLVDHYLESQGKKRYPRA